MLHSLQKLDGAILQRVAAGLLDVGSQGGTTAGGSGRPTAGGRGVAAAVPQGKQGGGRPSASPPLPPRRPGSGRGLLTNSVQQDQLRESIEKLDVQLGALQYRMKGEQGGKWGTRGVLRYRGSWGSTGDYGAVQRAKGKGHDWVLLGFPDI